MEVIPHEKIVFRPQYWIFVFYNFCILLIILFLAAVSIGDLNKIKLSNIFAANEFAYFVYMYIGLTVFQLFLCAAFCVTISLSLTSIEISPIIGQPKTILFKNISHIKKMKTRGATMITLVGLDDTSYVFNIHWLKNSYMIVKMLNELVVNPSMSSSETLWTINRKPL